MQMNSLKYFGLALLVIVGVLTAKIGAWWWMQREWFDLQVQQLATIERIGEFPPPGWDPKLWKNVVITPYNVWGNVTYHPNHHSNISIDEMRSLQTTLDQIVTETTRENSIESVDRIFQLMLQRGHETDFISWYHDLFRKQTRASRRRHSHVESLPPAR